MNHIKGNGKKINGDKEICCNWSSLNILNISSNIYLSNNKSNIITYSIDEDLKNFLNITLENDILTIGTNSEVKLESGDEKGIDFYISNDKIKTIYASDNINIRGNGVFSEDVFNLHTESTTYISLNLNYDIINLILDNTSHVNLEGKCNLINYTTHASSSSSLISKELLSSIVNLDLNGAAHVEIYSKDKLNIKYNRPTYVGYYSNPTIVKIGNGPIYVQHLY